MPLTSLSKQEQLAFKARLARRGLKLEQLAKEPDVLVERGARVLLSRGRESLAKPLVRKPGSVEELRQWIGIPDKVTGSQVFKSNRLYQHTVLNDMLARSGLNRLKLRTGQTLTQAISGNALAQATFTALARAGVIGAIDLSGLRPLYLYKEITSYVQATEVMSWAFVNVRIKAGGALVFDPPGPHSFVAHSLVIEPGGKIITNRTHVSFDCDSIEIL